MSNQLSLEVSSNVLDTQDFANRLVAMREQQKLVQAFFKEVMVPDQDYGVIPGTQKPTLYKAGAEKLLEFYGYAPELKSVDKQINDDGHMDVTVEVRLTSRKTGVLIAEGVGFASTQESKYSYRWVFGRDVPKDLDKSTLKQKEINTRNGKATLYRVPNDDLASLYNTIIKMAKKRALVDATLSATRSSGIFGQDADEIREWAGSVQINYKVVDDAEEGEEPQHYEPELPKPKAAKKEVPKEELFPFEEPQKESASNVMAQLVDVARQANLTRANLERLSKASYDKTVANLTDDEAADLCTNVISISAMLALGYTKTELGRFAKEQTGSHLLDLDSYQIHGLLSYLESKQIDS